MKTGIIRRIDDLGRIVIPQNIREIVGIEAGTPLEISVEGARVCLERCNSDDYTATLKHIYNCIKDNEFISDVKRENACAALDNVIDIMEGGK